MSITQNEQLDNGIMGLCFFQLDNAQKLGVC